MYQHANGNTVVPQYWNGHAVQSPQGGYTNVGSPQPQQMFPGQYQNGGNRPQNVNSHAGENGRRRSQNRRGGSREQLDEDGNVVPSAPHHGTGRRKK